MANPCGSGVLRCLSSLACCVCAPSTSSAGASADDDASPTFRGRPLPYANMQVLSEADLECVEQRHLYRNLRLSEAAQPGDDTASVYTAATTATTGTLGGGPMARQVVGGGRRCKHGWPQAIMYDPLYRERPGKKHRLGDTTRLTCPLLVSAIDKLEKAGAITRYNEKLAPPGAGEWSEALLAVNEAHGRLRQHLVSDRPEDMADCREYYGEGTFAIAMGAGLASMRPDSKDVKCLHAQVADEFVRAGNNPIAQQALRDIEESGVPIDGTDECCDNCDVNIPLDQARWRLQKCKNTAGKRLSRSRRQSAAEAAPSA